MVVDPDGPAVPVRPAGLLGALRVGHRARAAGSRGGRGRPGSTPVVELAGGDPEAVRGEHVMAAARAGDAAALAVLDTFAGWVALGIANLVNILDCEIVVIGGGVSEEADLFLDRCPAAPARGTALGADRRPVRAARGRPLGERPGPSAPPSSPRSEPEGRRALCIWASQIDPDAQSSRWPAGRRLRSGGD